MDKKITDSALKVIFTGSVFFLIGMIVSKVFSYLTRIVIARELGAESYGLFSLGLMIVGFFVVFSELGLGTGICRFISFYRGKRDKAGIRETLSSSLKFVTPLSILLGILLFFSADFFAQFFNNPILSNYLKILSFLVPLTALSDVFLATILGFERIDYFTYHFSVIHKILQFSIIAISLYIFRASILSVAFAYVISFFYLTLATFYIVNYKLVSKSKKSIKKEKKKGIIKELLLFSWPLLFVAFLGSILGWIDSFMIGYFENIENVGFYNSALPIAALLTVVTSMFSAIFLPVITKNYARQKYKEIRIISKQISKWYLFIVFPLFLLLIIFPGTAINFLFGQDFLPAETSLIILSFGFLFFGLSFASIKMLEMLKKTKYNLINLIIVAIIDVILNIILIPIYGISGAALATSISYLVYSGLYIAESYYLFDFVPYSRKFIKPIFSGILALGVILGIKILIGVSIAKVILMTLIFFLIYFVALIRLRAFDKEDILIIKYAEEKTGIKLNFLRKFAYKFILR